MLLKHYNGGTLTTIVKGDHYQLINQEIAKQLHVHVHIDVNI